MAVLDLYSLKGKKGFITGSAGGIGSVLADAFAEVGADLAVVDLNYEKAEQLAAELSKKHGRDIFPLKCDITDENSVNEMVDTVVKRFGTLNFCLNNAGGGVLGDALDLPYADYKKMIDVNLNGVYLTSVAAARAMVKLGVKGSIVSTASMSASIINFPQRCATYCIAKAGVKHLTKALAVEWADHGIRVNCVSPGYIDTDITKGFRHNYPFYEKITPMHRIGQPNELIGSYLYLVSDASPFTTGCDLAVDGGYTIQ